MPIMRRKCSICVVSEYSVVLFTKSPAGRAWTHGGREGWLEICFLGGVFEGVAEERTGGYSGCDMGSAWQVFTCSRNDGPLGKIEANVWLIQFRD